MALIQKMIDGDTNKSMWSMLTESIAAGMFSQQCCLTTAHTSIYTVSSYMAGTEIWLSGISYSGQS
jgi:hypothetical protein